MSFQSFSLTHFLQWSLLTILYLNLIFIAKSKSLYTSEVFGDLTHSASSKSNPVGYDKNVIHSPKLQSSSGGDSNSDSGSQQPDPVVSTIQTQTSRVPLYLYNPGLARQLGLSTLLVGGVIYGLTVIPALLATTGFGSFSDLFNYVGKRKRKKRSLLSGYIHEMPLMNKESTNKFLALFETTLDVRRIDSPVCKKYHVCKVYQTALMSGEEPLTLSSFEKAIINTFGIAAERKDYNLKVLPTVKKYFEPAIVGITGSNCTKIYPCPLEPRHQQFSRYWSSSQIK